MNLKDLFRHGLKVQEVTNVLGKPPTSQIVEGGNTHHQTHLSTMRAGKQAWQKMLSIGGEKHDRGSDAVKFIKKFDPQNSSGAVKDALDIMDKLQEATKTGDLKTSIQPLQNILGGNLYGAMQKAGAGAKSSSKTQKGKKKKDDGTEDEVETGTEDVIAMLIAAALEMLTAEDAVIASELLDDREIQLISQAYYGGGVYVSGVEIQPFVDAINQLIPIFRATQGAAVS